MLDFGHASQHLWTLSELDSGSRGANTHPVRTVKIFVMPKLRGSRHFAAAALFLLVATAATKAENSGEWPSWRGPEAKASLASGKYPVKWDATNVLSKVESPGKG